MKDEFTMPEKCSEKIAFFASVTLYQGVHLINYILWYNPALHIEHYFSRLLQISRFSARKNNLLIISQTHKIQNNTDRPLAKQHCKSFLLYTICSRRNSSFRGVCRLHYHNTGILILHHHVILLS